MYTRLGVIFVRGNLFIAITSGDIGCSNKVDTATTFFRLNYMRAQMGL